MYEDAVSFLARVEDEEDSAQRELYDDAKNEALRAKFQGIPEDFFAVSQGNWIRSFSRLPVLCNGRLALPAIGNIG